VENDVGHGGPAREGENLQELHRNAQQGSQSHHDDFFQARSFVNQGKVPEKAEGNEQEYVLEDVGKTDVSRHPSQRPPIDARDSREKGIPMEPERKGGTVYDEQREKRPEQARGAFRGPAPSAQAEMPPLNIGPSELAIFRGSFAHMVRVHPNFPWA